MPPSPSRTPAKPSGLDCRLAVLGSDVRLTPHRREVFEVLASSTDHPTAYDILDRVKSRSPGISLATVYNCLEHLTTAGLIKLVHLERGQSRYCANLHEHVHFHCESCGKVIDAHPVTDFDPAKFWNLPAGTKVTRTDLAIHGTCSACAAKS
ncbi:Fur family transcriptional regulator [Prosthecobacter fluviatilis]|uniref:Fur family transcriptional regulator n=1 Tax=Prosthecobacter fluviatilis TaxID=445931 RepID=A0ABW0KVU4_9BACT